MDDEDRLFMTNPLKALFIQNKEIIVLLKIINQEIEDDGKMDEDLGFMDGKNLDGY